MNSGATGSSVTQLCPVCCAPLKIGAHLCLECRSLVRLPRSVIYLAAMAGSVPIWIGLLAFLVDCRAGAHSTIDREATRAAESVKEGAVALEEVTGIAVSTFAARSHLANACESTFRDPEFFKLEPGEACTPQLLYAINELDRQMVALAYRLEVVPVGKDTQQRFDNFQVNYWAQDSSGVRIGYRQRILDAIHGVRDFKENRSLKTCGPQVRGTSADQECKATIAKLKEKVLVHIGNQSDATLCSVVRDVNRLRKAAYSTSFGYSNGKPDEADTRSTALIWRMLAGRDDVGDVCKKKLTSTPIEYKF